MLQKSFHTVRYVWVVEREKMNPAFHGDVSTVFRPFLFAMYISVGSIVTVLHSHQCFNDSQLYLGLISSRLVKCCHWPLLCNIFWCFLTDSQANDDVLSVFRLYSNVVADIRHAFIVHACSWFFFSLTFYLYCVVCYSAHGCTKLLITLEVCCELKKGRGQRVLSLSQSQCSDASTLLVGWKEGHPACKNLYQLMQHEYMKKQRNKYLGVTFWQIIVTVELQWTCCLQCTRGIKWPCDWQSRIVCRLSWGLEHNSAVHSFFIFQVFQVWPQNFFIPTVFPA